ncbi:MAG: GDP-mannose 4,6-dehydratase [Solirubrobacterales bacterium]|nr:GDP-mannose 4,6-dehydratase [Solirubrobacterales bacterium]
MRSLLTGGAGFIGSHLADELVRRGDEVLVLDDLSTGHESNLADAIDGGARLTRGDIAERDFVSAEVSSFAPERVFHLAAQADVRRANEDPAFDARVNVLATVHLLEAVRASGGPPLVFAATGGVSYGEGEGAELPFVETATPAPETAYGVSKLAGEAYVALYRRLHGVPGLALRFGNIYGPRQDPHGEAGVVAIFCGRLLGGEAPTVFGDGLQTRDYVFVADAVTALTAAGDALAVRGTEIEGPINIGTGIEASVLDLLDVLSPLVGDAPKAVAAPARPGEVQRVAIDPAKAGRELGWQAQVSLEDGLNRTLEFIRAQRSR